MSSLITDPVSSRAAQQLAEGLGGRRLLAVYDFIDLPYAFDISAFLINAELERRRHLCTVVDVAFVCHASDPGSSRTPFVTADNFRHFAHNYGVENVRLLPTAGSVMLFDNRQLFTEFLRTARDTHVLFPERYDPAAPHSPCGTESQPGIIDWAYFAEAAREEPTLLAFRPPAEYVNLARRWLRNRVYPKIPVTITLREWGWRNTRNSVLPEWQKLIDHFAETRGDLCFVVLRDYYRLYEDPPLRGPNVVECDGPVLSLPFRAAFYQECALNLSVSNGVGIVALANPHTAYIVWKIASAESGLSPEVYWLDTRLRPGDPFPGAGPHQWFLWEDDEFPSLSRHTERMLQVLENDDSLIPRCYRTPDGGPRNAADMDYAALWNTRFKDMHKYCAAYLRPRIEELLTRWSSEGKRLLVYGVGQHTDNLFRWTDLARAEIVGYVDGNPSTHGTRYRGLTVHPPSLVGQLGADLILISSNAYQEEIYGSLASSDWDREITRLY